MLRLFPQKLCFKGSGVVPRNSHHSNTLRDSGRDSNLHQDEIHPASQEMKTPEGVGWNPEGFRAQSEEAHHIYTHAHNS